MIDRRSLIAGLVTLPMVPARPTAAPLLPALPALRPDHFACVLAAYRRHAPMADNPVLHEAVRVLYQHMAGMRLCIMAYPRPDAITRLEAISARWPSLKRKVDLVIAARLQGREDWPWEYGRVRLDRL